MNNYCGNKRAFALVIAIGLTLIMALMAYFILEYMIPFARNTKGIENATRAYYQAETAIEDALYFVNIERGNDYSAESGSVMPASALGNSFSVEALGRLLPPAGKGNSEFNTNWNTISQGNPIQLEVGGGLIGWGNTNTWFKFRVPDLNLSSIETLSGSSTPIINWQLVSESDSLSASGSWITEDGINGSSSIQFTSINYRSGKKLDGINQDFADFYDNNCGAGSGCTLKLSVINKLELTLNNTPVPYLEWQASFDTNIPLRYTNIDTSGKSYGFKKDLEVRVPQQTVNEAFDFTVFQ